MSAPSNRMDRSGLGCTARSAHLSARYRVAVDQMCSGQLLGNRPLGLLGAFLDHLTGALNVLAHAFDGVVLAALEVTDVLHGDGEGQGEEQHVPESVIMGVP